ncbi:hypothetical protein PJL18_03940 [Paenarthrobacter nicotinovorans]|nr:hypothetical protein [Paenarthrobacter nicotinovorans]
MRATLHDPAVLNHQDRVSGADGGQAVRNHDGGTSLERLTQGRLHGGFVGGVQRRRRLIQNHHARLLDEQTCDGKALALAAGEPVATLPHHCLQAIGQGTDHRFQAGAPEHIPHVVLGSIRPCQAQVGGDGFVEQVAVLGHHAQRVAQGIESDVPHIGTRPGPVPAQAHCSGVDVVQAGQQLGDGGLAGTRGTHQGHCLARFHPEAHPVQHFLSAAGVQRGHLLQGGQGNFVC